MHHPLACLLSAAGLLFLTAAPAPADDPAKADPAPATVQTDFFGDPLPPGARVRLGSVRFRIPGSISNLRYTADGKSLFCTDRGGGGRYPGSWLYVLDAGSGRERRREPLAMPETIMPGSPPLGQGTFILPSARWCVSPDGHLLAVVDSQDHGIIKLRNLIAGTDVGTLGDKGSSFRHLQFTSDGKLLLALDARVTPAGTPAPGSSIRAWDVGSRKETGKVAMPETAPGAAAFVPALFYLSPNGKYLATVGMAEEPARRVIYLSQWDATKAPWRLTGAEATEGPVAFTPDGEQLAEVSGGMVRVWETASGRQVKELARHGGTCETLAFSPDGKRLVSTDLTSTGKLRWWDVAAGREMPPLGANAQVFVFTPDGRTLAVAGSAHTRLFEAATGKLLHDLPGHGFFSVQSIYWGSTARQGLGWLVAFSPDGATLAAGSGWGQVRRWSVATGRELPAPGKTQRTPQGLVFAPDGTRAAWGGGEEASLWDTRSGKQLRTFVWPADAKGALAGEDDRMAPAVDAVAFSPDGKQVAAHRGDRILAAWEADTGKLTGWVREPPRPVADSRMLGTIDHLSFAADSRTVRWLAYDGFAVFWQPGAGATLRQGRLIGPAEADQRPGIAEVVAVAPHMAVALDYGKLTLWEVATGKLRRALPSQAQWGRVSPDGKHLVVSGGREGLDLLDLATGKELRLLSPTLQQWGNSTFSADGKYLVWASREGSVEVRALATDSLVGSLPEHPGGAVGLAFTPDGQTLATIGLDGAILLWDMAYVFRQAAPPRVTAKEATALWEQLGSADAGRAGKALAQLSRAQDVFTMLKERLPLGPGAEDELRSVRAVELLEDLGTAEARTHLNTLANGPPKARLTREAQASLRRWPVPIRGGAVPAPVAPRVDALGDPLPEGARRRLGSRAFQHSAQVRALRYLQDGKTLLSTTGGKHGYDSVRLWDANDGRQLQALTLVGVDTEKQRGVDTLREDGKARMGGDRYTGVAPWSISPDGRFLALLTGRYFGKPQWSNAFEVRELATGKTMFRVDQDNEALAGVQYSPDGKVLAAYGPGLEPIRLYKAMDGRRLPQRFPLKFDDTMDVLLTFSSDGNKLVALGWQDGKPGAIRVFDLAGKAEPLTFGVRALSNSPVAFTPDGTALAVVSRPPEGEKGRLGLWNPKTGKRLRDLGPHDETSQGLVFAPNGKLLVSLVKDRARLWDLATGKELPALELLAAAAVVFSPDSRTLAVAGYNLIFVYDVATLKRLHCLPADRAAYAWGEDGYCENQKGLGWSLAFSGDGKTLAVAHGSRIRRWGVASGRELVPPGAQDVVCALALSARDGLVAAACERAVLLLDGNTGKVRHALPAGAADGKTRTVVTCVALSPDGRRVAAATTQELANPEPDRPYLGIGVEQPGPVTVTLWDAASGKKLWETAGHKTGVHTLAFTGDGQTLISAGSRPGIVWWDAATGRPQRQADMPDGRTVRAVSPDGRLVASGDPQRWPHDGLLMWEAAAAKTRWSLDAYTYREMPVAFAPSGRYVLSWSDPGALRLRDTVDGTQVRAFGTARSAGTAVFSPDGTLVAAADDDGLRLWETATGTLLRHGKGHRGPLTALAFSADGHTLASAGLDTSIVLWDVSDALCRHVPAPRLSAQELAALWEQLAADDAGKAYDAQCRLEQDPAAAIALLGKHLRPAPPPDEARLAQLLTNLEDERYKTREAAAAQLRSLDDVAAPALSKYLAGNASLEGRRRAEKILAQLDVRVRLPELARAVRCVELLQRLGTAQARAVLEELARGAPQAYLTREARGALQRLVGGQGGD